MNEMHSYSDEFIISMFEYYRENLGNGDAYDRMMIVGLYHSYQAEGRRRGIIAERE